MKKLFFFIFVASSFLSCCCFAQQLTPLASRPDWSLLQRYANTITATEFEKLLQEVYVPDGSWKNWITITPSEALIQPYSGANPEKNIILPFAASKAQEKPVVCYWKKSNEQKPQPRKPLAGLTIVIDPGHLGGSWARMEERWFRIKKSHPVEEGTMTLIVAKLLAAELHGMGANVELTRNHNGPTTPLRPYQLSKAAKAAIGEEKKTCTKERLKKMEELLFYRVAEIHHRADCVNKNLKPDLVICLHFNAEEWNDPKHPTLSEKNHLHLLISGDFGAEELKNEDVRYTMLCKLLGRVHQEEVALANDVANELATATGLPPFVYHKASIAMPASPRNPYLWNRNLLATRLMECPVVYCEPYVMNNSAVFQRVQLGNYEGVRTVDEKKVPSIYREYADAVARGIENYFSKCIVER